MMKKLLLAMMISLFSVTAFSFTLIEIIAVYFTPVLDEHFRGGEYTITYTYYDERSGSTFVYGHGTTADGGNEGFNCQTPAAVKIKPASCEFSIARR